MMTLTNVKNFFKPYKEKLKFSQRLDFSAIEWEMYLPLGSSILLSVLLLYSLSSTAVFFFETTQTKTQPLIAHVTTAKATLINDIPHWHLFGFSQDTGSATLTSLPLILLGVQTSIPANQSQAIISEQGGKEKIYRVGDVLPDGATLYEVRSDSVVIQYKGRLEKLMLHKNDNASAAPTTPTSPITTTPDNNQNDNNANVPTDVKSLILNRLKGIGNAS